jgi:PAS domain S-box-containing protein
MKGPEQRRSETERRDQSQTGFLQSILNALSAHIAVIDESGKIVATNVAWRMFAEANGMTWSDWGIGRNYIEICEKATGVFSEEACDIAKNIRLILNGQLEQYYCEYPCHSPDEKRWFQVRLTCFSDQAGRKVVAAHESITELKKAQETIRGNEELFRAVFESADDLILIKNSDLAYSRVNPAVERLFGRGAEEIIGRRAQHLWGSEAARHLEAADRRVLQGETVEEEFTRTVHGTELTFHDSRAPLLNAEGETHGICIVSRDITNRLKVVREVQVIDRDYPSEAMRVALRKAQRAASVDSLVLLLGESGSGKDHLARWIHDHSPRSRGPFFAINCAAVSNELAESELFGHEPGAFTGARTRKRGLLELAEGGTLLMNEIGELPLSLQAKLLTFLDSKSFLRVGGDKHIRIDARLMAATHRNLETEVAEGRFLEALFYRLNVFLIRVPPLRERREDLPVLVNQLLQSLAFSLQLKKPLELHQDILRELQDYSWPGNIRELRNVLERSLIVSESGPLRLDGPLTTGPGKQPALTIRLESDRTLNQIVDEVTGFLITHALNQTDQNAREAARKLGISRDSIYRHLKKLDMKPPKRGKAP